MLKLSLEKGSSLSAIQKTQLKNYGCSWSTMFKAWTYEEKDDANIKEYLQGKGIKFEAVKIPDIDKGKSVKEKALETRIDILTEQTYTARTTLSLELRAFDEDMVLADLDDIPLKDAYETAIQFAKVKDLHERWIAIKAQEKELENLITSQESQEKESVVFKGLSFEDMINRPPKKWLMDGIFGEKDIGMVWGAPGCGKTFIVIDMIVTLCNGGIWAHNFNVNEPLKVAYCAGEGISELPKRFMTALKSSGHTSFANLTFFDKVPQLFDPQLEDRAEIFINDCLKAEQKFDVLFIDTYHTAIINGDENSSLDTGRILRGLRSISNALGCVVILVHHCNKGGTSERGSGALKGAMDFMLKIENGYMYCDKIKDSGAWTRKNFLLSKYNNEPSVYVHWNNLPVNEQIEQNKLNRARGLILKFLKENPDIGYGNQKIAEIADISVKHAISVLNDLVDEEHCMKKPLDETRPISFKNPIAYFYRN